MAPQAGRLAYLMTGDRVLAEDIAQEAFLRLGLRLPFIRDPSKLEAYLRKTVINLAKGHRRKQRSSDRLPSWEIVGQPIAGSPDIEVHHVVVEALKAIPYRQRAALVLKFYEDLSEAEIAHLLGCAPGTVKSLVSRGKDAMRDQLERTMNDG
jgi:RNA polymerase sigma factor (sigma-70 family)